jgi:hypothetical protein
MSIWFFSDSRRGGDFLTEPSVPLSPSGITILVRRQTLMSNEDTCTDLVVDDEDVLMGEVVMSESTFPAAPLVRPRPVMFYVMLPPVLAHTSTCTVIEQTAETLITAASPSDFVRVSPTVATSLVTSSRELAGARLEGCRRGKRNAPDT